MSMAQNMMKDPNMMRMAEVNPNPKFMTTYNIELDRHITLTLTLTLTVTQTLTTSS